MIVTKTWVHAHKTVRGGWTKKQLAVLGVPWPPPKGWLKAVVGTQITESQRIEFEAARSATGPPL